MSERYSGRHITIISNIFMWAEAIVFNVLPVILFLSVLLWTLTTMLKAVRQQDDIKAVSADISAIREEQAQAADKLEQWQAEMQAELEAVKSDKAIEEQAARGWYRDIPLASSLQEYTAFICGQYGVDYDIVLAVMAIESNYKADIVSADGQDFGIMQINRVNHDWLADMGLTDMLDARQNIKAGAPILANLLERYEGDYEMALRAYNCGITGANNGGGKSYAEKVLKEVEK